MSNKPELRIVEQPAQQPSFMYPMAEVAGYAFALVQICSINLASYLADGKPRTGDRLITLALTGTSHDFNNEDADKFYHWYLVWTGQARVTPPTNVT